MELRPMRETDATAVAALWAETLPYLVRAVRAFGTRRHDLDHGHVAVEDGDAGPEVVAHASFTAPDGAGGSRVTLVVRREARNRGVGSQVLAATEDAARAAGATTVVAAAEDDGVSPAFAVRHGYATGRVGRFSGCDPRTVPAPGPPPDGFRLVVLDDLDDVTLVWRAHQATAEDDPSGHTPLMDLPTWHREFWEYPDNAPDLGVAVVRDTAAGQEIASYTMMLADPDRRVAWSTMTGTVPAYRGRGLAYLVKAAALHRAGGLGYTAVTTGNDTENAPMLAVNDKLGYREVGRSVWVRKTLA